MYENQCRTGCDAAPSRGCAGSLTADDADCPAPAAPVAQALRNLQEEISEVHYHADSLIHQIAPALRNEKPSDAEKLGRPCMASELAEMIQQMADNLRGARLKLADARERVTL